MKRKVWIALSDLEHADLMRGARIIIFGLGVVSLALVGCSSSSNAGVAASQSLAGDASAPASAQGDPGQICQTQLTAIMNDLLRGNYQTEMSVNGLDDPHYLEAKKLAGRFRYEQVVNGTTAAAAAASQSMLDWCTQQGNPVRSNYPTDGSTP